MSTKAISTENDAVDYILKIVLVSFFNNCCIKMVSPIYIIYNTL